MRRRNFALLPEGLIVDGIEYAPDTLVAIADCTVAIAHVIVSGVRTGVGANP
jgi:hypothetical protein